AQTRRHSASLRRSEPRGPCSPPILPPASGPPPRSCTGTSSAQATRSHRMRLRRLRQETQTCQAQWSVLGGWTGDRSRPMIMPVSGDLPSGAVTFLFTDIEGSTRLLDALGEEGYVEALAEHRRLVRAAFSARGGVEVDTQGDAFLYVFGDPADAMLAAAEAQLALEGGPGGVRVGLVTGGGRFAWGGDAGSEVRVGGPSRA